MSGPKHPKIAEHAASFFEKCKVLVVLHTVSEVLDTHVGDGTVDPRRHSRKEQEFTSNHSIGPIY